MTDSDIDQACVTNTKFKINLELYLYIFPINYSKEFDILKYIEMYIVQKLNY